MYFEHQDAVTHAGFYYKDMLFEKSCHDQIRKELNDSQREMSKISREAKNLKEQVENLERALMQEMRKNRQSEYKVNLYLHIASHFAGTQFNRAEKLAKRGQLEVRVTDRSCLQLEIAVARAYHEMCLEDGSTSAQSKLDALNNAITLGKEFEQ
jgi:uncharacterized protein YbgA (DUF1722 family)